ncbi:vesicular integral-membrane protein VIP36-like [Dermacentor silvarum]|uniref:vesicular integral-membrane protein VIP36-like n=1 Tax=Dermacentor silvarum TaxID=543639 RepID=UPI00189840C9|nr:vesicular integral-membrane protein VIP36-like [Dermacentor silvarum]
MAPLEIMWRLLCLFLFGILFQMKTNLFAAAEWNTKDYMKKEHSLVKPYQGAGMTIPNWDFLGHTMVTSSYIRLTPDQQSAKGAIWNNVPCKSKNWEMHVHFKVHGTGKELYGDGFAVWYAREALELGPVFGSKDQFSGLGIFFDTYANQNGPHNHGHPYISAMVNNGSLSYDHDRDGTHTELAGCEAKFRNVDHDTHVVIRYENDILTVATDIEGKNAWKECFTVKGVQLPTHYYFGASAVTGDLSDNHDIISMKLYEIDVSSEKQGEVEDRSKIVPAASFFAPPRDHVDDPPPALSGTKLFLIVLCSILGLVLCVIAGFVLFQKQQETSRKRFY